MNNKKIDTFNKVVSFLLNNQQELAKDTIINEYHHKIIKTEKRKYTFYAMVEQFFKDGFIDRYTGEKVINPGLFKILSTYYPDVFSYHPHGKTNYTHRAYWEMFPSIDHIDPIARGGEDKVGNWVTTTMKNNLIKNNYSLEELNWFLYPKGNIEEWDGLTKAFINLVGKDNNLLNDPYIKKWFKASKNVYNKYFLYSNINRFAKKWLDIFNNSSTIHKCLFNNFLAEDCEKIGFKMDCGKSFIDKYGKSFYNYIELDSNINKINDIELIENAIYSKW